MRELFLGFWYRKKILQLKEILPLFVGKKRLSHIRRVANTCAFLARKFKVSVSQARLAAYLHDLFREIDDKRLLAFARDNALVLDASESADPLLLHGKIAGIFGKNFLAIRDKQILEAVTHHTLGFSNLSKIAKILYIADYLEPGRSFTDRAFRKKTAQLGMNEMILSILDHNKARGFEEHERTKAMRIYLSKSTKLDIIQN